MLRKIHIQIIIIIATIGLTGLIFMQLFWIRNAVRLAEQQYDHRVTLALSDVLTELTGESGRDSITNRKDDSRLGILQTIDTELLDCLIEKYFDYYQVNGSYRYAIVKSDNDSTVFSNRGIVSERISVRSHKACLSCLWEPEEYHLVVFFPQKRRSILLEMGGWLILSTVFLLMVVCAFAYIVLMAIKQKKLSEMKTDFINNMTHELKTPISSISLASEVILRSANNIDKDKLQRYSRIINDENTRLKDLVDKVLQVSRLEREDIKLNFAQQDLHTLITDAVENRCLDQCIKTVKINYQLNAKNSILTADKMHLTNIIVNMLDNAYKYSEQKPEITITTWNEGNAIALSVKDNGIGMNAETQKMIFDKFYRVHTGNLHAVKGFGLGLYYVKKMVDAHLGTIEVKSAPAHGSNFIIRIPQQIPV